RPEIHIQVHNSEHVICVPSSVVCSPGSTPLLARITRLYVFTLCGSRDYCVTRLLESSDYSIVTTTLQDMLQPTLTHFQLDVTHTGSFDDFFWSYTIGRL
ncbi:unnamed protein product, partial [Allacma fusca]